MVIDEDPALVGGPFELIGVWATEFCDPERGVTGDGRCL